MLNNLSPIERLSFIPSQVKLIQLSHFIFVSVGCIMCLFLMMNFFLTRYEDRDIRDHLFVQNYRGNNCFRTYVLHKLHLRSVREIRRDLEDAGLK
jgi:hypothetical protein